MKENVYIQAKEVKDEPTEHVIQTLHNAHPMLIQHRMCTRRVSVATKQTRYIAQRVTVHTRKRQAHTHMHDTYTNIHAPGCV